MNIAFVSTTFMNNGVISGGLPQYLNRTAGYLAKKDNNVVILYHSGHNMVRRKDGIKLVSVKAPRINNSDEDSFEKNTLLISYAINARLEELIESEKLDIVQFTSLNGLGLFYRSSTPVVMRLSSYTKLAFVPNKTMSQKEIDYYSLLERESSTNMDGIFAPSNVTADCFSKDIGRGVDVIESPLYEETVATDDSIYNEKLQGKRYALFFGVLYFEKGITDIADIIHDFLKSSADTYFVMAGKSMTFEGKDMVFRVRESAGEYADRLIYIPELEHKYLYPIIEKAEFVVLPSRMENFSNACIEAMHFEKVVIGTNGASFEQLIDDGVNGLLCEIGNPESLLHKMKQAAGMTASQRAEMGRKAKERIDLLKPEYTISRLLDYYEEVINNKNSNRRESKFCQEKYDYVKKLYDDHKEEFALRTEKEADKRMQQFEVTLHWLRGTKRGYSCKDFFIKNGYHKVAIYGLFELGQELIEELKNTEVEVVYGVDRIERTTSISVFRPDDELPEADVMVVTAMSSFEEIYEAISIRFKNDIVSLEDVVYDMVIQ